MSRNSLYTALISFLKTVLDVFFIDAHIRYFQRDCGGPPEPSLSRTTLSSSWAGTTTVAAVMPMPIATYGSPEIAISVLRLN